MSQLIGYVGSLTNTLEVCHIRGSMGHANIISPETGSTKKNCAPGLIQACSVPQQYWNGECLHVGTTLIPTHTVSYMSIVQKGIPMQSCQVNSTVPETYLIAMEECHEVIMTRERVVAFVGKGKGGCRMKNVLLVHVLVLTVVYRVVIEVEQGRNASTRCARRGLSQPLQDPTFGKLNIGKHLLDVEIPEMGAITQTTFFFIYMIQSKDVSGRKNIQFLLMTANVCATLRYLRMAGLTYTKSCRLGHGNVTLVPPVLTIYGTEVARLTVCAHMCR